jgi:hypothetical protein
MWKSEESASRRGMASGKEEEVPAVDSKSTHLRQGHVQPAPGLSVPKTEILTLGWIDPTSAPRVAAGDAAQAAPGAAESSVFLDRRDHVVATGGVKTAVAADEWAKRVVVYPHQSDHRKRGQSNSSEIQTADHFFSLRTT